MPSPNVESLSAVGGKWPSDLGRPGPGDRKSDKLPATEPGNFAGVATSAGVVPPAATFAAASSALDIMSTCGMRVRKEVAV